MKSPSNRVAFYNSRVGPSPARSPDNENSTKKHTKYHEIIDNEYIPPELLRNVKECSPISKIYHLPKLTSTKEKEKKLADEITFTLQNPPGNLGMSIEKKNDVSLINNEMIQK